MGNQFRAQESHVPVSRRLVLKGILTAGAAAMPIIADASPNRAEQEFLSYLTLDDDHAAPMARRGDVVAYDTSDRELIHGNVYVTLTDKAQRLYVTRAFRDGKGHWWAERFGRDDWYGPIGTEMFRTKIQGRAVATFSRIPDKRGA